MDTFLVLVTDLPDEKLATVLRVYQKTVKVYVKYQHVWRTGVCVYLLNCYFIASFVPEEAKEKAVILGYNWTVAIST